jgi:hypothetical protein
MKRLSYGCFQPDLSAARRCQVYALSVLAMAPQFALKPRSEILWVVPHDALGISRHAKIAQARTEKNRTPRTNLQ